MTPHASRRRRPRPHDAAAAPRSRADAATRCDAARPRRPRLRRRPTLRRERRADGCCARPRRRCSASRCSSALWALRRASVGRICPARSRRWQSAVKVFGDPFYRNGPNDQGIGWNILISLRARRHRLRARRAGRHSARLHDRPLPLPHRDMAAPIISLLRPVSPLAWLPIGLLVFKAANPAAIWVIFISQHLADDHQHRRRRAAQCRRTTSTSRAC